ncbi:hypothetical protein WOLCODRAFT_155368 [Wolfiporia cocos MD-104 SS10]|uniref:Uncharacterized protein n=1 Tax=Wolfiporia cocos (strain MD-104) TaxID=742152 RepID=A0A2H3IXM4_WOLCO|nr:hypothetical protein WOLCODRAFT_155368 [Wolfiporia cocos MD-104 SS10]
MAKPQAWCKHMQQFDPDLPNRLIQLLPEAYRRISYGEKYEWRDPPTGFFTKGGYLTIPSPDRLSPTWVQVPPSLNDPWDQTRTAFERFGTVADIMTPTLVIQRADGQQQGGQTTNTPSAGGAMGVASTTMGGSIIPGSGSTSQSTGGMANNPPPEYLEEEAFLEGEVPQEEEVPWAAAIQQVAWEAIREDRRAEEAPQVEEDCQAEEACQEARQEAQEEEVPTTRNQPGEIA